MKQDSQQAGTALSEIPAHVQGRVTRVKGLISAVPSIHFSLSLSRSGTVFLVCFNLFFSQLSFCLRFLGLFLFLFSVLGLCGFGLGRWCRAVGISVMGDGWRDLRWAARRRTSFRRM